MSLTDEDTELSAQPWVAELQKKGGELVRRHYASLPQHTAQAEHLGALLARRRALLSSWHATLARDDLKLRMPDRLIPERDYAKDLAGRISRAELREWERIVDELRDSMNGFEAVREPYLRSVERHEVQHRLDYLAERLELPELLARRLGGVERTGHDLGSVAMRSSTELSAYLSQIADDPAPLLAVLTMSRAFFDKHLIGGPHSFAALVALVLIVVTGAAVRLTGSGLGCPDWPTCDGSQVVSEFRDTPEIIEFVNRMFTGVVSVAVAAAVLGARRRVPYRRDLALLAWGLVAGVVAQIVLGGITVLLELTPPAVMAHFLLPVAPAWEAPVRWATRRAATTVSDRAK